MFEHIFGNTDNIRLNISIYFEIQQIIHRTNKKLFNVAFCSGKKSNITCGAASITTNEWNSDSGITTNLDEI